MIEQLMNEHKQIQRLQSWLIYKYIW